MRNNYYQNRNGKIHSEESRRNFLSESKEVEHELSGTVELIKRIMNEKYEYYNTSATDDKYNVVFKKSGEDKYKNLEIIYGSNYKKIKGMFN